MTAKVIEIGKPNVDEDEEFAEFIDTLKSGNTHAVFLISKEDGSISIGSTARDAKELLWDLYQLKKFMDTIVEG